MGSCSQHRLGFNRSNILLLCLKEDPISTSKPKTIEIVAGPNGSGKTTFAKVYLFDKRSTTAYLNPDLIASGIAPFNFEKASFHAGRVLISEAKTRITQGESFAFESTLSGKTWRKVLKDATTQGYQIIIYFLYLDAITKNLQRIKKRVALGGHSIPPEAVRRRHPRCFYNFWNLYRPLCSDWYIFDNSGKIPKLLKNKSDFEKLTPDDHRHFTTSFLKGKIP